jgi:ribosomal protein S18 acetylase RimI-like enzyme
VLLHKINDDEMDEIAMLFSRSFADDPLFEYLFPNIETRVRKAKSFFKAELSICKTFTYCLEDSRGAIIFEKSSDHRGSMHLATVLELVLNAGIISVIKAIAFLAFSKKVIKKSLDTRMDHLSLVCVGKDFQGKGLAKQMIDELCDRETYLETQNPLNIDFYKKLGFSLITKEIFIMKGNDLESPVYHYVMTRS